MVSKGQPERRGCFQHQHSIGGGNSLRCGTAEATWLWRQDAVDRSATRPAPSGGKWHRLKQLFSEVFDLSPESRRRFLDELSGEAAEGRTEVEKMLSALDGDADFLESPAFQPARRPAEPAMPDRIGGFRVIREIGRGGMGCVFEAVREEDGTVVALKVPRGDAANPDWAMRFDRERRLLARLRHPNIIRFVAGGVTGDGIPYLAMEYVAGHTLDEHFRTQPLSFRERLELFATIAEAVDCAHSIGIVHRDIKPSNILVDGRGIPYLLDFGISKSLESSEADRDSLATEPGSRLMTPDYAAPEQIMGDAVSPATDVYALGVMLFRLLTGKDPYGFKKGRHFENQRLVCESAPAALCARLRAGEAARPALERLDEILKRTMEKSPARRFRTAGDLAESIRRLLEQQPISFDFTTMEDAK